MTMITLAEITDFIDIFNQDVNPNHNYWLNPLKKFCAARKYTYCIYTCTPNTSTHSIIIISYYERNHSIYLYANYIDLVLDLLFYDKSIYLRADDKYDRIGYPNQTHTRNRFQFVTDFISNRYSYIDGKELNECRNIYKNNILNDSSIREPGQIKCIKQTDGVMFYLYRSPIDKTKWIIGTRHCVNVLSSDKFNKSSNPIFEQLYEKILKKIFETDEIYYDKLNNTINVNANNISENVAYVKFICPIHHNIHNLDGPPIIYGYYTKNGVLSSSTLEYENHNRIFDIFKNVHTSFTSDWPVPNTDIGYIIIIPCGGFIKHYIFPTAIYQCVEFLLYVNNLHKLPQSKKRLLKFRDENLVNTVYDTIIKKLNFE